MDNLLINAWATDTDTGVMRAPILTHESGPAQLDISRIRFTKAAEQCLPTEYGCILSVTRGCARLELGNRILALCPGVHCYIPPGTQANLVSEAGGEFTVAAAGSVGRARGEQFLLRDEEFLSACGHDSGASRWILTPQYLSRRVFLHHDKTLLSATGQPLSWFHTTMFDVDGLPPNQEGRPVFKMSYNYRTELNVCYEVSGKAALRVATHPYCETEQVWSPWWEMDDESTYCLLEDESYSEYVLEDGEKRPRRNKHEVRVDAGHVSLYCMFNPAPTGAEQHSSGAYSEYGDLEKILGGKAYASYLEALVPLDKMLDALSIAKAEGREWRSYPEFSAYKRGKAAQIRWEAELRDRLMQSDPNRNSILANWYSSS